MSAPEYVGPSHWPGEAWEALLDRFFADELDVATEFDNGGSHYVLLRIPADIDAMVDAAEVAQ